MTMNNFFTAFGAFMAIGNFVIAYVFARSALEGFRKLETLSNMDMPYKEPWFTARAIRRRNAVRLFAVSCSLSVNGLAFGCLLSYFAFISWVGIF